MVKAFARRKRAVSAMVRRRRLPPCVRWKPVFATRPPRSTPRYPRFGLLSNNDLVFDAATTRNEPVPASERVGGALEFVIKPTPWFVSSGSGTYTRATFTQGDSQYHTGDKLPYVPELIIRQDLAFTPTIAHYLSRPLTGRFGASLTGMFDRPQPYGQQGHDVFLVDLVAQVRLKELAVGLDVFNLLDAHWYDSEFTYSANWNPGAAARIVPERYVTVGAPRTILGTLSLFVD